MRLTLVAALVSSLLLSACGKKEESAPAPVTDSGPKKVSIDAAPSEAPPPPPPVAAAPPPEAPPGAPAAEVPEGNWFSKKTVAEKREIMEGWLHQYQVLKGDDRAEILKQVKNSKLTPADLALLEELRNAFKYPPFPAR
jgi:hypothetical protein